MGALPIGLADGVVVFCNFVPWWMRAVAGVKTVGMEISAMDTLFFDVSREHSPGRSSGFWSRCLSWAVLLACVTLLSGCDEGGGSRLAAQLFAGPDDAGPSTPAVDSTQPLNLYPVSGVMDIDGGRENNLIMETAPEGSEVGITLFAEDRDMTMNAVWYELRDDGGLFGVDKDTGVVTLSAGVSGSVMTDKEYRFRGAALSEDGSMSVDVFTVRRLDDMPPDDTPPYLAIHFPTPQSLVTTSTVYVRGEAVALGGKTLGEVAATLGGSTQTTVDVSEDGSWSVVVTGLVDGFNLIEVAATDSEGFVTALPVVVNFVATLPDWNGPPLPVGTGEHLRDPTGLALDKERNRLLVVDKVKRIVVSVDLATGDRTVLSGDDSGPRNFAEPRAAGLDLERNELLVLDRGKYNSRYSLHVFPTLFAVDLRSGMRRVVSSSGDGTVPRFSGRLQGNIAVHGTGRDAEALITDYDHDALYGIHLDTRARRTILRLRDGLLEGIQSVILDPEAANQVIVSAADPGHPGAPDMIFTMNVVDPSAESITILASSGAAGVPDPGSGHPVYSPQGIVSYGESILVYDVAYYPDSGLTPRIVVLNRDTLVRRPIVPPEASVDYLSGAACEITGICFSGLGAIAIDEQKRVLYVVHDGSTSVIMVDLVSGAQTIISN